ncbi:hypothetical protein JWV26_10395 [Ectopseudomonas toyotomiensis]|uniref:Uncharacterized protein n=1 Tax=Ectopseudomonas toyotomiensis TaxID=554344 RepID=A0ABD7E4I9_9GAMM|nr:hypothetical protein [Pseudomonas toyotomiensis]QSL94733.1 hypothetical protein JWV26_10395 [Pseudomonas toyotomiensis]
MKNLVKKKKRLFDGAESDFYVFSSMLDTTDLGSVLFDNRQVQYLWELGERQADALIGLVPGAIKHLDFPGDTPAYKQGNLALYVQRVTGQDDNHSVLIVVAAGESQPARFVIDLCGVFVDE